MMKRLLDVAASVIGLVATAPLLVASAVAVRLESGAPVIFRQERVGRAGRTFEILKLRTMLTDMSGAQVTTGHDPRITRSGQWLRSMKIDELPQLINVLRGDMSLVGPRPEVPRYVAHWPDDERDLVLSVRPGITDPASIEFRREAEQLAEAADPERYYVEVILPRKLQMYCEYVRTRSFIGDLRIIMRTFRTIMGD